jgi:hypothetical protein
MVLLELKSSILREVAACPGAPKEFKIVENTKQTKREKIYKKTPL